ncbi:hypothetical protein BGZ93_004877 [Podila epicladia]|nr:hypothetical protein BGZ93_004877 [Podila epicladia]
MSRTSTSASPKPKIKTSVTSQTFETIQTLQGKAINATNFFGPPVPSSNLVHESSNQLFLSSSQFFEDRYRYNQIVGPERVPLGQIFPPGQGSSSQTNQNRFGQTFQLEQTSTSQVFQSDQYSMNPVFPEQPSWSMLSNDPHRGSSLRTDSQSRDAGSAFNSFMTALSSSTSPNSHSLMNEQLGSTQQTEDSCQDSSQISQTASQISVAQGWISRVSDVETWRSGASQHTESSDDLAPSSQASAIYISSDSDTDLNDTKSLDRDSELSSYEDDLDNEWNDLDGDDPEDDSSGDLEGDNSCDSDTTVRPQQSVLLYDDRASQSHSDYSYSPGSQLSQEIADLEDGYPSRLQVFLEGQRGTEDDTKKDPPSQELDYGIGSWIRDPTVPEWMHELDDEDDDEELFYEPLKRIRHQ